MRYCRACGWHDLPPFPDGAATRTTPHKPPLKEVEGTLQKKKGRTGEKKRPRAAVRDGKSAPRQTCGAALELERLTEAAISLRRTEICTSADRYRCTHRETHSQRERERRGEREKKDNREAKEGLYTNKDFEPLSLSVYCWCWSEL